jgi:hypothetical protein
MLNRRTIAVLLLAAGIPASSHGASLSVPSGPPRDASVATVQLVEFYHAGLDHYFVSASATEVAALDQGTMQGWRRTGASFTVLSPNAAASGAMPVCRFYGLPQAGLDSHFYSGAPDECAAVAMKFAASWLLESPDVFQVWLPDASTGACPAGTVPIYRLFNNRSDANHRYTDNETTRQQMLSRGFVSEGYGPNGVAFCALPSSPSIVTPAGAPPAHPPPAPLPPIITADRVKASYEGTDWFSASRQLRAAWTNGGGDWVDSDGTFNGPVSTISQTITSGTVSIDISGIDGDLMIQGIDGWDQPTIDGQPAVAFWTDSSTNHALQMPAKWHNPGIVLNPARGHVFTFTTQSIGQTIRIDKVAGPAIVDYPTIGPSKRPDIVNLEMTDEATTLAAIGSGNYAVPYAYQPEYSTDPSTGLRYLRFSSANNQRLISWFLRFPGRESVFARYCIYIEDDVADGMTELGMKLPGLAGDASSELLSWRMEHGPVAPNNRGLYSLVDYLYDAESGPGFGVIQSIGGAMLRAGRWYVIEQRINLNAPGVSNGIGEVYLNGHLMFSSSTMRFRDQANTLVNHLHVNVYHGGLGMPSHPIHYRIAKIGVSSSYIGVPTELMSVAITAATAGAATPPSPSVTPLWRNGLPKDIVVSILDTANMGGVTNLGNGTSMGSNTIDAWNGLAAGATTWWAAANGGHDQGNGTGWENKVYKIDLAADAPRWALVHPGSPRSSVTKNDHYADGLPTSRHTYYSSQYIGSLNRIMLFGASAPYAIGFPAPAYQGGPIVDGFNTVSNTWDAGHSWADIPFTSTILVSSFAKHASNDNVYFSSNESFARWSPDGEWHDLTAAIVNGPNYNWHKGVWQFAPSLIDASRNKWVHLNAYGAPSLLFADLAAPNGWTEVAITGPITSIDNYSSLTHDLDNDRYLTVQGSGLYAINPTTGLSTLLASVPPAVNGVHNRLAYFRDLGGVAYLPEFSSSILFMPTR